MADPTLNPSTTSLAYRNMECAWEKIDDILAGAAHIRSLGEKYLPKYEAEKEPGCENEYKRRLASAPWRPEFDDALGTLASKPFSKDIELIGTVSDRVKTLAENIDGCGNNITAFCRQVFRGGIARGLHGILVDYPKMNPGATRADELRAGANPYWVTVSARDMIALYTAFDQGKEIVTHVRIKECEIVRDGFSEYEVSRVRVYDRAALCSAIPGEEDRIIGWERPTWEIWEADKDDGYNKVGSGDLTLDVIPLVLFWTGERKGSHYVKPPLSDLADMQIELYRALSRHEETLTYAGSPMLQGKGIAPPRNGETLATGPKRILFAPPGADGAQPEWDYIAPEPGVIEQGAKHIESVQNDMRRIGMQPLTQQSGNPTATGESIGAAKAHSVCQAWALGLKDVIEQAFVFTGMWLKESATPDVEVFTDFSVVPFASAPLQALKDARASKDIDQKTYLGGLKRFTVLGPDDDPDEIIKAVANEGPAEPTAEELAAAMTPPSPDQQDGPPA